MFPWGVVGVLSDGATERVLKALWALAIQAAHREPDDLTDLVERAELEIHRAASGGAQSS